MATTRQRNTEMRATLAEFSGTQLIAFLKGMDAKSLAKVTKALTKLGSVAKKEEAAKIKKQIAKLEATLTKLNG